MAHSSRHNPTRYSRHTPLRPRGPWANGPIPVIGLVGGIGSGKSLAAETLAGLGLQVLDADAIGHALLTQRPARSQILDRFGPTILKESEESAGEWTERPIDRGILGRIVFSDPAARRDLEAILHPMMRKTFERAIQRAGRPGNAPAVVLDAAILFEAGWNSLCDAVLFIDAPREARLARLQANRGWSTEDLDAREQAQSPLDEKQARADHVLSNIGEPGEFRAAVAAWWASFLPARRPTGRPGGSPRSKR